MAIIIPYYKPSKLGLTIKEIDEVIYKIKTGINTIDFNDIKFRKVLRQHGDTFGGLFHVLEDICNENDTPSGIVVVKKPDTRKASEEFKEDEKIKFNDAYDRYVSQ